MRTEIARRLGCEVTIFAFTHCRDVVVEVTRAGGFGVLGSSMFGAEALEAELRWIDAHVDGRPYGVDVVIPAKYESRAEGRDVDHRALIPQQHRDFMEAISRLFTFLRGGDVKRLHPAHAAREGLLAALLVEAGPAGPAGALEDPDGFFHAYSGERHAEPGFNILAQGGASPGSPLVIAGCYLKPYACCRHLHPAIDALLDILREQDLAADDVQAIEFGTYAVAASHAGVGWSEMTTAQMSFNFALAAAVLRRRVTLADFGPAEREDPAIHAIAARVAVATDAACDAAYPANRPAQVRLATRDGRRFARLVPEPLGSALNPLSDASVRQKYQGLATPALGAGRAAETRELLWNIEECRSLAGLAIG